MFPGELFITAIVGHQTRPDVRQDLGTQAAAWVAAPPLVQKTDGSAWSLNNETHSISVADAPPHKTRVAIGS